MLTRRTALAVPFVLAAGAGVGSLVVLRRMQTGDFDPRGIDSPRIGHLLPDFVLPPQPPGTVGFSSADIRAAGHPVLLNFFASWCVPCAQEAPTLAMLQAEGAPLWGVAYKDTPQAAAAFLDQHGNPFTRLAADPTGRVAIDFGVYGVPETWFIDRAGIIRWRWAGALTEDSGLPQLRRLQAKYA